MSNVRLLSGPVRLTSSASTGLGNAAQANVRRMRGPTAPATRALRGLSIATDITQTPFATVWYQPDRRLTTDQLWRVYTYVPDVRAPIDSIVRRVATRDWSVEPFLDPDATDALRKEAAAVAMRLTDFLTRPAKGFSWQSWATSVCTDLLIYDMGVAEIELPKAPKLATRPIAQLFPRPGDTFYPVTDEHGVLVRWVQSTLGANGSTEMKDVPFEPEDLFVLRLFRNTRSERGMPLIETIVNEASAMAMSSDRIVRSYDADEIPPGLLLVAGLGADAAATLKEDFRANRGHDERIRMIVSPQAKDLSTSWIELSRTLKDLDMVPLTRQVQRTIWRVFGVQPIEMGDDTSSNRATATVQFEVGDSHLLTPIYEHLEGEVNESVRPAFDPKGLVRFRFVRSAKPTAADSKTQEEAWEIAVRNGTMTINEVRLARGQDEIEGGDVPGIFTPGGFIPISSLGTPQDPKDDGDPGDDEPPEEPPPSDGGSGDEPPDEDVAEDDQEADRGSPGPAPFPASHQHLSVHHECLDCRAADDLPSDWQPEGRLRRARSLDLPKLADTVGGYYRTVEPLYDHAQASLVGAIAGNYTEGGFSPDQSATAHAAVDAALNRLARDWSADTEKHYLAVGRNARDSVKKHLGTDALKDTWEQQALTYQGMAMGWLTDPTGLIGTLSQRLHAIVTSLAQDEDMAGRSVEIEQRQKGEDVAMAGLDLAATASVVSEAVQAVFDGQQHRINNWSGKLVGLGSTMFRDGGHAAGGPPGTDTEMMVEWIAVGDEESCPECLYEGGRGWIPLSELGRTPGEGTSCRANDRCVLQMAPRSDVESGAAESLSNYSLEPDPLAVLSDP